jgi:hypothetical protein
MSMGRRRRGIVEGPIQVEFPSARFRRFVRFGVNEELVGFKPEGVGEFLYRSRGGELLFGFNGGNQAGGKR